MKIRQSSILQINEVNNLIFLILYSEFFQQLALNCWLLMFPDIVYKTAFFTSTAFFWIACEKSHLLKFLLKSGEIIKVIILSIRLRFRPFSLAFDIINGSHRLFSKIQLLQSWLLVLYSMGINLGVCEYDIWIEIMQVLPKISPITTLCRVEWLAFITLAHFKSLFLFARLRWRFEYSLLLEAKRWLSNVLCKLLQICTTSIFIVSKRH